MKLKKIAVIGTANSGKNVFFNKFSKSYELVSNYVDTTYSAVRKEADFAGERIEVVDTPGIFSLNLLSDDERVARDVLVDEKPDLVFFCGDATNLKKSLILLGQVLELSLPTVLCLNNIDEAAKKGISIDAQALSGVLGLPVAQTAGIHGIGLKELESAVSRAVPVNPGIIYPQVVEKLVTDVSILFPPGRKPTKGLVLMLLNTFMKNPDYMSGRWDMDVIESAVSVVEKRFKEVSDLIVRKGIMDTRDSWAGKIVGAVSAHRDVELTGRINETLAGLSRHPVWGWPILFSILWAIFASVGKGAAVVANLLDTIFFLPMVDMVSDLVPKGLWHDFLVGHYGILTMGFANAIGTVVPILFFFFIIVNFLEDAGYLPNLSILVNRVLRPFGLNGKAVLPMVLGFGCNTMATLTTRMLDTRRERIIAIFLIALGFPCAVQLGVLMAILSTAPFQALVIVIGVVATTQIIFGVMLNMLVPSAGKADFAIELPPMRLPKMQGVLRRTYFRIKWFLAEAVPMFIVAAMGMFFLEVAGLLAIFRVWLHPVITGFLSLPDKMAEVFILVLSRREVGAVYFKEMVDSGELDFNQVVVGLVVITLFIPCASNTIVMFKELGGRWAVAMNVGIIAIAILVGGGVDYMLRR